MSHKTEDFNWHSQGQQPLTHVLSANYIVVGCNIPLVLLYIAVQPQDCSGEVIMNTLILSSID